MAPALKGMQEMQFAGIDTLNLTFGKVVYVNLKPPRQVQEQKIGIQNEIFAGIKTAEDLQQKILLKIMTSKAEEALGKIKRSIAIPHGSGKSYGLAIRFFPS